MSITFELPLTQSRGKPLTQVLEKASILQSFCTHRVSFEQFDNAVRGGFRAPDREDVTGASDGSAGVRLPGDPA